MYESKSINEARKTHNFEIDEIKQITACSGFINEAPVLSRDDFDDQIHRQDSLECQRKNLSFIFDTQMPEEIKNEVYGSDYVLKPETQTNIANYYVDKQMKVEMAVLKPDLSNDQEYKEFAEKDYVQKSIKGKDEWLDNRNGF